VGTAVVAALGVLLFSESMSVTKAVWIAVIVVGVIGLQASSGGTH
jgi:multidrug transporter EmrE-like cation transporter